MKTAINEAKQGFGNRLPPLTIVEHEVEVDSVVDLTTPGGRSLCEPWSMQLNCAWKKLALAGDPDALITLGHNGIIAPSFAPGAPTTARNLILWRWEDEPRFKVTVFDPDRRLSK
jgi:RES domain-containing protein